MAVFPQTKYLVGQTVRDFMAWNIMFQAWKGSKIHSATVHNNKSEMECTWQVTNIWILTRTIQVLICRMVTIGLAIPFMHLDQIFFRRCWNWTGGPSGLDQSMERAFYPRSPIWWWRQMLQCWVGILQTILRCWGLNCPGLLICHTWMFLRDVLLTRRGSSSGTAAIAELPACSLVGNKYHPCGSLLENAYEFR